VTAPAAGTALFVVFATRSLDLSWLPVSSDVIVVHNDASLDRASTAGHHVVDVDPGRNVGFGAAINLALDAVGTERVVLCNPDVVLTRRHWDVLLDAGPDDVVTVPLVDAQGQCTSVTSAYPTPISHLVSGYRLGRLAPRGSRARALLGKGLGTWGTAHDESLHRPVGTWPLRDRWVSGAVLSVDTARLRSIGGFDDRYFLYYEDVDLCRRLARRFPAMRAVVADIDPGVHRVGASATADHDTRATVERIRCQSATRYAREQRGLPWRACASLLRARSGTPT
jgi:GT2 family glycosyltransferase